MTEESINASTWVVMSFTFSEFSNFGAIFVNISPLKSSPIVVIESFYEAI
jgi:hypothetical protein